MSAANKELMKIHRTTAEVLFSQLQQRSSEIDSELSVTQSRLDQLTEEKRQVANDLDVISRQRAEFPADDQAT